MENELFILDYIKECICDVNRNSFIPVSEMPKYDLALSQVIEFLNSTDKLSSNKTLTKDIIQNCNKHKVISNLQSNKKNRYKTEHLVFMEVIKDFHAITSYDKLKKLIDYYNNLEILNTDVKSVYNIFLEYNNSKLEDLYKELPIWLNEMSNLIPNNIKYEEKEKVVILIIMLLIMHQASLYKRVGEKLIDTFCNE